LSGLVKAFWGAGGGEMMSIRISCLPAAKHGFAVLS